MIFIIPESAVSKLGKLTAPLKVCAPVVDINKRKAPDTVLLKVITPLLLAVSVILFPFKFTALP